MSTASLIIVLLIASSSLALDNDKSAFTKVIRITQGRHPFKFNDELKIFESNTLISITPDISACTLTNFHPYFSGDSNDCDPIYTLGNGKLLIASPRTSAEFQVLELRNCSSYVPTLIVSDFRTALDYHKVMRGALVTYNDTFDVFDWHQTICMPCRYNDKGEQLDVEFPLDREPTGVDPRWVQQHKGFSLDFIEHDFGVKNGYLYVFRYVNNTSALRILDSQFKVVKQRLFPAKIEAHSLSHGNITVCYKRNACKIFQQFCEYVECHSLDADLISIAQVKLHRVSNDTDIPIHALLRVKNLIDGGAMVAMQFAFDPSNSVHHKDIFLQRIRSDGSVDEPIKFDSVDNDFVCMNDFTFDDGEYCLVTVGNSDKKGSYTLMKCLNTSVAVENY